MLSPENMLVKRTHIARHARRGLPNVLKARFSPTAIWATPAAGEEPPTPTSPADTEPLIPVPTRQTTSSAALTTRITTPTTSSPTPTAPTQARTTSTSVVSPNTTTPSSSTNAAVAHTTSSTSNSILSATRSSITPTTAIPPTTLATNAQTTAHVTRTVSSPNISSGSSLGSAASATSSSTESSGMSTAGVVGIAAAGIVGAVALVALAMFFIRRRNRKENEYDPDEFKRQSVMLPDDNASLRRGNSHNSHGRGGPRPPTMIERHNQNIATFAAIPTTYQSTGNSYGSSNPFNDYSPQPYQSFAPGMYAPNTVSSPPPMPQYANASPYYSPTSQSPVGSPNTVTSYGGAAYDAHGNLVRSPSNAAVPMLSRNNSVLNPEENPDYLTRASVTPFQAAQYVAISKQLNIPPPQPLQQVSEAEETEVTRAGQGNSLAAQNADSEPMVSPFEDPRLNPTANDEKVEPSRPSSEFHAAPEPAPRVPSTPPSLPEIKMMSGSFSPVTANFPVTPSPRKGSFDVGSGRASPKVDLPPLSPVASSPQKAQFNDGLEARAHDGHETPVEIGFIGKDESVSKSDAQPSTENATQAEHKAEEPKSGAPKAPVPKRPETLYSDEDAYGGF